MKPLFTLELLREIQAENAESWATFWEENEKKNNSK
jgi:hypothetical protein